MKRAGFADLEFRLQDKARRPGTKKATASWAANCAVDKIRDRFGWDTIGYGSVMPGISCSIPAAEQRGSIC
jgi:DNA polymerase-4